MAILRKIFDRKKTKLIRNRRHEKRSELIPHWNMRLRSNGARRWHTISDVSQHGLRFDHGGMFFQPGAEFETTLAVGKCYFPIRLRVANTGRLGVGCLIVSGPLPWTNLVEQNAFQQQQPNKTPQFLV